MALTEDNYYQDKSFFSVSLFKSFQRCPARAMAILNGEWEPPKKSKALLLGSFVDEALTGTEESMRKFLQENERDIYKKGGGKYAEFVQAEETIERIRQQPLMMKYLSGEHQRIMTGEIEGVPFKIKMDSYQPGEFIADLKYMSSLRSPNMFEPMIKYWGYDLQAACYQEIVRQNTGETLPFLFIVATKESPSHLAVGQINDYNLEDAMEIVRRDIKRFAAIKRGEIETERCEDYNCEYCTTTKILTEPIDTDLFGLSTAQINSVKGVI